MFVLALGSMSPPSIAAVVICRVGRWLLCVDCEGDRIGSKNDLIVGGNFAMTKEGTRLAATDTDVREREQVVPSQSASRATFPNDAQEGTREFTFTLTLTFTRMIRTRIAYSTLLD